MAPAPPLQGARILRLVRIFKLFKLLTMLKLLKLPTFLTVGTAACLGYELLHAAWLPGVCSATSACLATCLGYAPLRARSITLNY